MSAPLSEARLKEMAEYYCDVFEKYSVNTPIDRMLPENRVAQDDMKQRFRDYDIHVRVDLHPFIKRAMRRRGLSFKRKPAPADEF